MNHRSVRSFAITATLAAVLCSCARSQGGDNLRDRIVTYWRTHSCEGKCRNPIIEVHFNILKVVSFDAGRPKEKYVRVQELSAFLQQMPSSAWPKGPQLWVRMSDFEMLKPGDSLETVEAAERQNMKSVIQICNEMKLTPTNKDGSPRKGAE